MQRAADLVSQLLAFSRKQVLEPRVVDVGPLLTNLGRMLERLVDDNIQLVADLPAAPLAVRVDPGQLEQAVVNLVTNARDAMPGGGRLMLKAERRQILVPDEEHLDLAPGDYAVICVTDDGVGIPSHLQDRVFDPFFTTKGQGKGTGLGLATVYGVIKQSGGHVAVHSQPGEGSRFEIFLPLSPEHPEEAVATPPAADAPGGTETILLVEDDEAAASLMARVLRRSGYRVLTADRRPGSPGPDRPRRGVGRRPPAQRRGDAALGRPRTRQDPAATLPRPAGAAGHGLRRRRRPLRAPRQGLRRRPAETVHPPGTDPLLGQASSA